MHILRYMLIFVPLAVLAEFVVHNDLLMFVTSVIALVPLAGVLGEATEALALHYRPKIGGLSNATPGNAAALVIGIVAISAGQYRLVKASLTGSIIGNLLLIAGFSLLLGGLRHVVEPVAEQHGARELFLGVILILIVGNVAERLVGVQAAIKNDMDRLMNIALGSSMQIARFVAPLLVFISLLFGREQTLFFSLCEVMVLGLSMRIASFIPLDRESNWKARCYSRSV